MISPDRLRIGSMCTGYGGLDLAVRAVLGGEPVWCAESDRHAAAILKRRFPAVPNLGDLTVVDWEKVPPVDVVTAGWPCQDISLAGRGAGIRKGTRSGLWITITGALRLLRPPYVFLENVAALRTRGLGQVLGDLAALGYDTAWLCLRASDIGAPHRRDRMFILAARAAADPDGVGVDRGSEPGPPGRGEPAGAGLPAAHAQRAQLRRGRTTGVLAGAAAAARRAPGAAVECGGAAAAHPARLRRDQGQPEPARLPGRSDPALGGVLDWGPYEPAIRRWERVLDRPAPEPTDVGRRGQPRLSVRFVEWMMGLDDGWVTGIDISRTAQMRALGNGVVPHQAARALRRLAAALDPPHPAPARRSGIKDSL